jgi:hypothetical protein
MKTYHTVTRVVSEGGVVAYLRDECEYYEDAAYYEKYYTDRYSYPDTFSACVINQFVTESEE